MGTDMLQVLWFKWESAHNKPHCLNGNWHVTSLIVWMGINMLQASGNQSLIQMGIGMLQASWFKWESKPHCSNGNWHVTSLMVQMGIKASLLKWELACYKLYGSNGNQSLIAQMKIGTVLASLSSLLLCVLQGILEPFSKVLSFSIQNCTLKLQQLIDICSLCNRAFSRVGGVLGWMVVLYRLWAKVCFGLGFLFCQSLINCKRFMWTLSPNNHKHLNV